jgi:uroporphyrinogen decarboxylase
VSVTPPEVPAVPAVPAGAGTAATGAAAAGAGAAGAGATGAATDSDPRATRFLRACRREPVDVTPVWFMRQAGRALPEYRAIRERATLVEITRDAALCAEVTLQPVRRLGVDAAILFADITTPFTGLGVDFDIVEGRGPVVASPVRTAADVASLRTFEPEEAVGALLDAIRLVRDASPVPLIGFAGAPFTLACYLVEGGPSRDFARTKTLMHADPGTWAALMDRLADTTVAYLHAQVAAGAQAVQVFDSWVGSLSPADYRRSVAPWMARIFEGLRPLHVPTIHFGVVSGGLLRQQAAAGGDVIGLDWRIELAEGWEQVGRDRGVQGNLDPTLLLGPFEAVARDAEAILDAAGGRPGHVFNLGHGVLPGTDPDALARLVDLVHSRVAATEPA